MVRLVRTIDARPPALGPCSVATTLALVGEGADKIDLPVAASSCSSHTRSRASWGHPKNRP
jgi:hypothetical protein